MPDYSAKMAGIHSGVVLDTVGFFANIIHPLDELPAQSFKVLQIKHEKPFGVEEPKSPARSGSWASKLWRRSNAGSGKRSLAHVEDTSNNGEMKQRSGSADATSHSVAFATDAGDAERGRHAEPTPGIKRRRTAVEKITETLASPTLRSSETPPAVPPLWNSPIHAVTALSFLLTLLIVALSVYWRDGTAILAISLISIASSVTGYASWWKPMLQVRSHTNKVPPGDVMIRTREGAFILIKCTDEVARELYYGTEECKYRVNDFWYRILMAVATVVLMVSVVLLGNTQFNGQVIIGASYILLNALYWVLGMMPKRYFWDLSRYDCRDITPGDAMNAENTTIGDSPELQKSFTRTLWYAIRETKLTSWIDRSGAAPSTDKWRRWLKEAVENAKNDKRNWPAVQRKNEIMMDDGQPAGIEPGSDPAEQHAPLTEIQSRSNQVVPGTL